MTATDQAERWAMLRSQHTQHSQIYLEHRRSRLLNNLERAAFHIETMLLEGCPEESRPRKTIEQRTDLQKQIFASPLVKSVVENRDGSLRVITRTIGKEQETASAFTLLLKPNSSGYQIVNFRCQTGDAPSSGRPVDGALKQAQLLLQVSGNFRTIIAYAIADGLCRDSPPLPDAPIPGRSTIRRFSRLAISSNPVWSIELADAFVHGSASCQDLIQIDARLQELATVPAKSLEEYRAEYEWLCQLPRIESITVDERGIRAETRCVYLTDMGGIRRKIGRFQIVITVEQGAVHIHNLDHKVDHFDHPHVSAGNPCWGNMNSFLAAKSLEGAWPDILLQAVEFVFSVNHRDCYCPVSKFPAA